MTKHLFDCSGKVTLVTGGNSGIGLGFAMGPARMGGDIAIWARNADRNARAKERLLAAGARRVETYQIDVASEEAVSAGYRQLIARLRPHRLHFRKCGPSRKKPLIPDARLA